jgi:hypothetical protein
MPRIPSPSIGKSETVNAVVRPRHAAATAQRLPTPEEIRVRAYELYLARGAQPGREAEDWAKAEAELRSRALLVR